MPSLVVAVATLLLPRPEVPVVIYCSTFPLERQNLRIAVIYSSAFPLEQIAQTRGEAFYRGALAKRIAAHARANHDARHRELTCSRTATSPNAF